MLLVLASLSVTGFCGSAHATGQTDIAAYGEDACCFSAGEKQCPAAPVHEHEVPDHCDSSCNCPCHAPLTAQLFQLICSRRADFLVLSDSFQAVPEVYLPKFIPPHILV